MSYETYRVADLIDEIAMGPFGSNGCRANNPDICRNYMLEGVCAFVRDDLICKQPSRSWKRQYEKLKETENE